MVSLSPFMFVGFLNLEIFCFENALLVFLILIILFLINVVLCFIFYLMNEVLIYRSFVHKLIGALRFRLSEEKAKVVSDKVLARFIGLSPSEFSRVCSGVVAMSSLAFFRLLCICKQYNLSIDDRLDGQLKIDFLTNRVIGSD